MAQEPQHEARAAIRPVKESVEDALIAQPGVVAVDIAEKVSKGQPTGELSIVVFVESKKPVGKLPKGEVIPTEIEGIKTDVQELTIELQAMFRLGDAAALVDTAAYPTLAGGIGMGPTRSVFLSPPDVPAPGNYVFVGTLGAIVRDRASGATMGLTNFHVACINNTWTVGDRMVQPSLVDGGSAATQQFGSLTRATLSENVDGAVVSIDAAKVTDPSVTGIGDVAGSAVATVGMAVQKRGRTTEHTFGTVASTDFTVTIDYGSDVGSHTLRHQVRIDTDTTRSARFSDHGDSGSVVLDTNRNVVGLLFAGSNDGVMTFANPIAAALDELAVDLVVRPPVLVTRPGPVCWPTRLPALCPTRITVLCPTRSPIQCFITRPVVCRPTRLPICDLQVSRPLCDLTVTRAVCGDPGDLDPGGPIERPGGIPGGFGDQWGAGGHAGQYGDDTSVDETYWAGYLAALQDVADEDEKAAGPGADGQA